MKNLLLALILLPGSLWASEQTLLRCNISSGNIAEVKVIRKSEDGKVYSRCLRTSGRTMPDKLIPDAEWNARKFNYIEPTRGEAGVMSLQKDPYDGRMGWWYENHEFGSSAVGYADCE